MVEVILKTVAMDAMISLTPFLIIIARAKSRREGRRAIDLALLSVCLVYVGCCVL